MSLGRNSIGLLRRLRRRPNVRLVQPYTSTHELIRDSVGVVVISSTVGLEALLYDKPVLTLGDPFYAGFGVTLDVHAFAEIRRSVFRSCCGSGPTRSGSAQFPAHAAMRNCYPGAPVLVDRSEANARTVAETLERAALGLPHVRGRSHQAATAGSAHQA